MVHSQRLLQDWLRVALHLDLCVCACAGRSAGQSKEEEESEKMMGDVLVYPNAHMCRYAYESDLALSVVPTTSGRWSNSFPSPPGSLGDDLFVNLIPKGIFELMSFQSKAVRLKEL